MNQERPRIAVVDDEADNINYLREVLSPRYEIVSYLSPITFLNEKNSFDGYLLDIRMPAMSGLDLADKIVNDPNYTLEPVLLITSYASDASRKESFEKGILRYVDRYVSDKELLSILGSAMDFYFKNRPLLKLGNLNLNLRSFTVRVGKDAVSVEMLEFQLLRVLLENPEYGVQRGDISDVPDNNLANFLTLLNKKLIEWDYLIVDIGERIFLFKKLIH